MSAVGPTEGFTTGILNDPRGAVSNYLQPTVPASYLYNPIALVPQTRTTPQEMYIPVYFHAARDPHAASPIEVRPAETAAGIDITVERVGKHRIGGTVVDARTGVVLRDFQTLRADDPPSYIEDEALSRTDKYPAPGIRQPTGEFEMRDVIPGKYLLIAQSGDLSGRVAVEVRDADLNNVVIPATPGFNMTGHFTIEGRKEPKGEVDLTKLRVWLQPDPYIPGFGFRQSAPVADGSFTLKKIAAGDYRVLVEGLPNGRYVHSIGLQSEDLLNDGLHMNRQPDSQMEIVLGIASGSLNGAVGDEKRLPIPNARVVLVPARRNRIDLFKTARTGESGEFSFESVPPGDYKLFTWQDIEDVPGSIRTSSKFTKVEEPRSRSDRHRTRP